MAHTRTGHGWVQFSGLGRGWGSGCLGPPGALTLLSGSRKGERKYQRGQVLRPSLSSVSEERWMPRPLGSDETSLQCLRPSPFHQPASFRSLPTSPETPSQAGSIEELLSLCPFIWFSILVWSRSSFFPALAPNLTLPNRHSLLLAGSPRTSMQFCLHSLRALPWVHHRGRPTLCVARGHTLKKRFCSVHS